MDGQKRRDPAIHGYQRGGRKLLMEMYFVDYPLY
jgi:hypothetical protein